MTEHAIASHRTADIRAKVFGVVFFAIACAIAYWVWPAGITDQTLVTTTIGQILRTLGSIVVVSGGLVIAAMVWA